MSDTPLPKSFNEVYLTELQALRPGVFEDVEAAPSESLSEAASVCAEKREARIKNLTGLYRLANDALHDSASPDRRPLSALCLSGGGIRSATFNLGIMQGLARLGVLQDFDYLSSVSGGGYIASWLKAWMYHAGRDTVLSELARSTTAPSAGAPRNPLAPEAEAIDRLREYSNYLTPRRGLFSPDAWTAAATIIRNLLLNWLVIVPILAAAVAIPQVALLFVQIRPSAGVVQTLVIGAIVVELAASVIVHWLRHPRRRKARAGERIIVVGAVLPVYAAAALLALAAAWVPWSAWAERLGSTLGIAADASPARVWLTYAATFVTIWTVAIPLIGWLIVEFLQKLADRFELGADAGRTADLPNVLASRARTFWWELLALVLSGALAGALLLWIAYAGICGSACGGEAYLLRHPTLFVILALPILLGDYLLARTLFVAIASLGEGKTKAGLPDDRTQAALDDFDREWWARLSGWVLALALGWLVFSSLSLIGGFVLQRYAASYVQEATAALGSVMGILTAVLSKSSGTSSGRGTDPTSTSKRSEISLRIVALIFILAIGALLALGTAALGRELTRSRELLRPPTVQAAQVDSSAATPAVAAALPTAKGKQRAAIFDAFKVAGDYRVEPRVAWTFLGVPALLILIGSLFARVVNVNRFSLHGFYRNRLVRAYLGASNANRKPDPFTGFAPTDNVKLHRLWPISGETTKPTMSTRPRPLPVINTTLNLVTGTTRLAWQLRKAESFSMTPFYCGNFHEGYRPTNEYGGREGISLGTAVAISGAAANPNMGYVSSPTIGFLMTLLNARLGAWLGNTNEHGAEVYRRAGPKYALKPLFAELFGQTSAEHKYVNLSDGGHFDNLGLYEMVLRRCRHILLCDAGRDPSPGFQDLGNAIRKIRVDFGIPIEFETIQIFPRERRTPSLYCAVGTINYSVIDGRDVAAGTLIYIKPALFGHGAPVPYDVLAYWNTSPEFPHESTADQWFDEAQFESYRILGLHIVRQIGGPDAANLDFPAFVRAVRSYVMTAVQNPQKSTEPSMV